MFGPWGVIAHQGGWDEALMIAVPVAVFGGLVWVAVRREQRHDSTEDGTPRR